MLSSKIATFASSLYPRLQCETRAQQAGRLFPVHPVAASFLVVWVIRSEYCGTEISRVRTTKRVFYLLSEQYRR